MSETTWYDEIVTPALLRAARGTYGGSIRRRLAEEGFDDVPANGPFILGGLRANGPGSQSAATLALGITKQAASQLIDTLVIRGYVTRAPDPDDRRRTILSLTERGDAAAAAVARGVQAVEEKLVRRLGSENVAVLRAGLAVLSELRSET